MGTKIKTIQANKQVGLSAYHLDEHSLREDCAHWLGHCLQQR
jgi:hypothetical protein